MNEQTLTAVLPSIVGNVSVAAPSGTCPSLAYGVWNVALSLANTISKKGNMVTPNPTAAPWTPAIIGFVKVAKFFTKSLQPTKKIYIVILSIFQPLPVHLFLSSDMNVRL